MFCVYQSSRLEQPTDVGLTTWKRGHFLKDLMTYADVFKHVGANFSVAVMSLKCRNPTNIDHF